MFLWITKLLLLGLWTRVCSRTFGGEGIQFLPRAESWTDQVSFDSYSLSIRGHRIFLYSGEFHTFRLPVPDLWPDILQKFKAAGLNGVSIYVHWALTNPSRGTLDFDGFRALKPLYEAAQEAGLWVVIRPGPYINAETTGGGSAHWVSSEIGVLRNDDPEWTESWQAYIKGFIEETIPYQITEDGPIVAVQIDNEYIQTEVSGRYFQNIIDVYDASDIVVPLTYNDAFQGNNFINGTGAVNLYGLDSYPQLFDCSNPYTWNPITTNYRDYHKSANPLQPFYSPEFQGGSFDAWGPNSPGYDQCAIMTGPDFMSVFYQHMWAMNMKLLNFYMIYGGTSWGALPNPPVYTSYDYGASISENRELGAKYDELKRQGLFIRSSPDFSKTDFIGDNFSGLEVASTPDIFVTCLKNPDSKAGFYVVRHNDSGSMAVTDFELTISTSEGELTIPIEADAMTLNGRRSKIVVADYAFGSSKLLYSTASILYAGVIDDRDVVLFYGDTDETHEFAMKLTGDSLAQHKYPPGVTVHASGVITFTGVDGIVTVHDSNTQLVLVAETQTATSFWAPVVGGATSDPFRTYFGFGTNDTVLIGGSGLYLVRSAEISGSVLALTGDLKSPATATIVAPASINTITWNGIKLRLGSADALTSKGGFVTRLPYSGKKIKIPKLKGWKYRDTLPEVRGDFDDSTWSIADHTSTKQHEKALYGDGRVLYGCDYGYCENIVLWRGHFDYTGEEKSANLSINGGPAFAASVWLNDKFLRTTYGNYSNGANSIPETDEVYMFPKSALMPGENILTVVQDNMGIDAHDWSVDYLKSPRGIRGFNLNSGNFSEWKVQGKVGGYQGYKDKVRGVLNEGGLFAERNGWHLPGFDVSSWTSRELRDGLPNNAAGLGFFVTTLELDVPDGFDVPMSFTFKEGLGQSYRVYLFVNGWMMGKRIANLGPQYKFPVHEGILNYHGTNTIAVALWAMEPKQVSPDLELSVDGVYEGGVGNIKTNNPGYGM